MKINKYNLALLFCFSSQVANASDDFSYSSNLADGFAVSAYQSSIALKGRLQYDVVNFKDYSAASQDTPFKDTTNGIVRRGNIGVEGTLINILPYEVRLAYDRKEHSWDVDRAWAGFTGWQFADFYFGRDKFGFGLEGATSSSWALTAERPIMYDLTSGRDDIDYGYAVKKSGSNYSIGLQAAKLKYDSGDKNINDNFGYYGRLTYVPLLSTNQILHLGFSYHDANPDNNDTKIASRLETRTRNDDKIRFADISNTTKDDEAIIELGYQYDSFRLQSEYFYRTVKGADIETKTKKGVTTTTIDPQSVRLDGGYLQLSYLFDSSRRYSVADGKWGKPNKFNTFEPFYRFEYSSIKPNKAASKKQLNNNVDGVNAVDRDDRFVVKSSVLGVNYFYNENLSFNVSYIHSHISNIDTSKSIDDKSVKNSNDTLVARAQFIF